MSTRRRRGSILLVFARLQSFAGAHASLGFASLRGHCAALLAARNLPAFAAIASLATAIGCSDAATTPTTDSFASAREASAKPNAATAPQAVAPSTVRKEIIDPISGVAQVDTGYTYDPTGKRDPFRSFVWDRPDRMVQVATAGPLEEFDLSQLEVVAVVWRTGNARALVEDPSGESYIVGEGAAIGKNQGRVITIDDNSVVVKEIYVDYLGQETTKDIEMRMRRNEGG